MQETPDNELGRKDADKRGQREDLIRWERYRLTGEAVSHETVRQWLVSIAEGKTVLGPR